MTISTTTTVNRYTGNAATTVFPYSFRILAATDLVVTKRLATTLVESTLNYPADYSVSGVGNATGGSVTLTAAPATGDLLVIERVMTVTQPTSIRNNGSYFAETHENVFDRGTMVDQQQATALARTFQLSKTIDPATLSMSLPVPVSGQVLTWGPTGLTNGSVSSGNVVLPGQGRDTTTLTQYLANNYVYNVFDYDALGDGVTDDAPAIQAAITACVNAGGGVVFFPIASVGFRLGSRLTLTASVPLVLTGPGKILTTGDVEFFNITGSQITLDGLYCDGQQTAGGSAGHIIELLGASDVRILNCRLLNARLDAIRGSNCSRVWVTDNRIEGPYEHGVSFNDISGAVDEVWVVRNRVYQPGLNYVGGGANGKGINFESTNAGITNLLIAHNEVRDALQVSIELWSDDLSTSHFCRSATIANNRVRQSLTNANTICISVAGSQDVTCVGNQTEGGVISYEIAYSTRVTYLGNVSRNCIGTAISVSKSVGGNLSIAQAGTITGNTILNPTTQAIQLFGVGVKDFVITDNTIDGTGSAACRGIIVNNLGVTTDANIQISNNRVRNCGHSGIYVLTTKGVHLANNNALGNNTSASGSEDNIYLNFAAQADQVTCTLTGNKGSVSSSFDIGALRSNLALSASATTSLGLKWQYRAGERWLAIYRLPVQVTGGTAGLTFDCAALPTGLTGRMMLTGTTAAVGTFSSDQSTTLTSASAVAFMTASFTGYIEIRLYVTGGTADGPVDLQVITGASAAGNIFAGTSLELVRV